MVGLNFDFIALNITGFLCYSAFNVGLFWITPVQVRGSTLFIICSLLSLLTARIFSPSSCWSESSTDQRCCLCSARCGCYHIHHLSVPHLWGKTIYLCFNYNYLAGQTSHSPLFVEFPPCLFNKPLACKHHEYIRTFYQYLLLIFLSSEEVRGCPTPLCFCWLPCGWWYSSACLCQWGTSCPGSTISMSSPTSNWP